MEPITTLLILNGGLQILLRKGIVVSIMQMVDLFLFLDYQALDKQAMRLEQFEKILKRINKT